MKYIEDTKGLYSTFSMFVMVSTSVHERVPDYHTKKSLVLNFDCLEQVGQYFEMLESLLEMIESTGITVAHHL